MASDWKGEKDTRAGSGKRGEAVKGPGKHGWKGEKDTRAGSGKRG